METLGNRGLLYGFAELLIVRKHINANPVEKIKVIPEHSAGGVR